MTIDLIIEDGTMPDGSNTYVDIAYADKYLAQRGASDWVEKLPDKKASALIRATDTLNSYVWKGKTAAPGRVMSWPRQDMKYADGTSLAADIIPAQLKNSQCELAANILLNETDPLAPVDTSQGAVTSERVDVIAVSYATPETNNYNGITGYPFVDSLLKPFLSGGNSSFGTIELGRG